MANMWNTHQHTVDKKNFRGEAHYVGNQIAYPYKEMVDYIRTLKKPWFDILKEDHEFAPLTGDVDGTLVSRDLLDSILELEFLEQQCGLPMEDICAIDIGSGYGRLAYRLTTAFPKAFVYCTDAIPLSQGICREYLQFRKMDRAEVVLPSELDKINTPKLAINIHSWPECARSEINGWLDWIVAKDIPYLFVIPHQYNKPLFACLEDNKSFLPEIEAHGFSIKNHWRPLECSPRDFFLFYKVK